MLAVFTLSALLFKLGETFTLAGLGAILAGLGSALSGYAALRAVRREPKPPEVPKELPSEPGDEGS